MMISAIVLAAGLSRRMGQNKLLFRLGDKTVIECVLEAVREAGFDERLLVTKNDKIILFGKDYGFNVIYNENPEVGQSGSVKLGVLNADKNSSYMFFVGDQPFVTVRLIETLIGEYLKNPDKITVPVHKGKRGNPVIFPNKFRERLLELGQDKGGRGIIDENAGSANLIEIEDEKVFFDIDTPDDYNYVNRWRNLGKNNCI